MRYFCSADFYDALLDSRTRLSFGLYRRHDGTPVMYAFKIRQISIDHLTIAGGPVLNSVQAERVAKVMAFRNSKIPPEEIHGRAFDRVLGLIEARERGEDSFLLLVTRGTGGKFDIDDGATRASILAMAGERFCNAVLAIRV